MLFNSIEFAIFFPAVVLLYFLLPYRWRIPLLLAASYGFYMRWRWQYGLLILWTTILNYGCALGVARAKTHATRNAWAAAAWIGSLGPLFYFKYLEFFADVLNDVFAFLGTTATLDVGRMVLPVGISFFTFQALSYTMDVYRGKTAVERRPLRFALFVAFFPQLVAGPIERASNLLKQFQRRNIPDPERFASGFRLMIWGLFKKVVIADRLAIYVDRVYAAPDMFSWGSLCLATYFFAFQIYCDFSGYSDIAIGAARILGYDLMKNFRRPYLATSIGEFWHRWHISLATWFRDYVYIPLGGNRVPIRRWMLNGLVVFVLSGIWHGAGWTFLVWGALHGVFYVIGSRRNKTNAAGSERQERQSRIPRRGMYTILNQLVVFHLVLLGWVFFRSASLTDALHILSRIATTAGEGLYLGASQFTTALSLGLLVMLVVVEWFQERYHPQSAEAPCPSRPGLRHAWVVTQILGIALLGVSSRAFIYFQF